MVFTKPVKIPRWADTGTIVEPAEAKKDAGWLFQEIPPSSYENWKENLTGSWFKWLNERLFDGITPPNDFRITGIDSLLASAGMVEIKGGLSSPVVGAFVGGDVRLLCGAGVTGGSVRLTAADGVLTGGGILLDAGNGSTTPGDITMTAGDKTTAGGSVGNFFLLGGSAFDGPGGTSRIKSSNAIGTNQSGGILDLESGNSTGNVGSNLRLRSAVAGASGATVRTPEDFLVCDGTENELTVLKTLAGAGALPVAMRVKSSAVTALPALELLHQTTIAAPVGVGGRMTMRYLEPGGAPEDLADVNWYLANVDGGSVINFEASVDFAGLDAFFTLDGSGGGQGSIILHLTGTRNLRATGNIIKLGKITDAVPQNIKWLVDTITGALGTQRAFMEMNLDGSVGFNIKESREAGGDVVCMAINSPVQASPLSILEIRGAGSTAIGGIRTVFLGSNVEHIFTSGRVTFTRSSSRGNMNLVPAAGDPSAPVAGDIWYNSTTNKFRCVENVSLRTISTAP